ncbi:MAG: type II toxin-antitoxin system RelE/ParE family toxin [Janthinobacterium lividum]
MLYNVKTIEVFEKQAKRLIKNILRLEMNCLNWFLNSKKIRLAIASKGKGKSGGAKVIINIVVAENDVYLLTIYDKSEKENISPKELQDLLKDIPE